MFRSLRRHNFRLFLAGQLVSNLGTWMQNVALAWLVLQISHSPLDVGVVSAVQFVPSLAFSAYGGVVADRFFKRNLLLLTQSGMAVAAAALGALDLSGFRPLWALYLVTFVSGMFGALDMPARQSFVSEMVGLDDLPNAVALNSAMFNLTRVGGPALGAVVIEVAGVGDCFVLNAFSYIAVIAALLAMRPGELFAGRRAQHAKGQVREGFRYIMANPRLRQTLGLLAVLGTLGFNFNTVLPVLAKDDFKGDAGTYALMLVAIGLGSVLGALTSAYRQRPRMLVVVGAAGAMGIAMLVAAVERDLAVEIGVLVVLGFASMLYLATSNATCQLASAPEMRGRVMGVYAMIFVGSTPVGAMLVGLVDQELSARWGLAVGGVPAVLAAAFLGASLAHRRELRGWLKLPGRLSLHNADGAAYPSEGAGSRP
jgi:MFS family permease